MDEPYCHYCAVGHPFQPGNKTQHILTVGAIKNVAPCRKYALPSNELPGGIILQKQGQTRHVFSSAPGGDQWDQAVAAGPQARKVEFIAKKPAKRKKAKIKAKTRKRR
jgi:hypothetical protein